MHFHPQGGHRRSACWPRWEKQASTAGHTHEGLAQRGKLAACAVLAVPGCIDPRAEAQEHMPSTKPTHLKVAPPEASFAVGGIWWLEKQLSGDHAPANARPVMSLSQQRPSPGLSTWPASSHCLDHPKPRVLLGLGKGEPPRA